MAKAMIFSRPVRMPARKATRSRAAGGVELATEGRVLGHVEKDERDDHRQPHRDPEPEKSFLADIGDHLRHAGEDDLPVAEGEGEAAEQDAGTERRDEGADLEPDGEDAVDHAADDAGDDHDRDDDAGAVPGLPEDGAEHRQEADHVAEREVEFAGDQGHDRRKSHA